MLVGLAMAGERITENIGDTVSNCFVQLEICRYAPISFFT